MSMIPGLGSFLSKLRLPWLFVISAGGLLLNLLLPDPLPFLDEILMALVTAVIASLRKPKKQEISQKSKRK